MVKIIKKDYPFTIIIEDKTSNNTGKEYQAISIAHITVKNKEATDPKEKYETKYFNFFDERDLLKISSLAENAYIELNKVREMEKKENKKDTYTQQTETVYGGFIDDDVPF